MSCERRQRRGSLGFWFTGGALGAAAAIGLLMQRRRGRVTGRLTLDSR